MGERYKCTLSPELLKKAIEELNEPEDNDKRLAAIDKLRTRFEEEDNGLELIRSDDAFLLRFLRVRKFDQDRAYTMLFNYHKQRKEWRELFDLVDDPSKVDHLLRCGAVVPLYDRRAKDGTFITIGRPGLGFDDNTTMVHFIAVLVLTLEKLLENEEFQIYGLTIIEDMADFGLYLAMQMPSLGSKFLHIIQDAMPVRVKSVNMIHEALVFDVIYSIISSFMKEKMKNRLTLHGDKFDKLHEKIDPANLPFSLGGSGPDLNPDWWTRQILADVGQGEDTAL
uniref:alpha-tocopherol transfer protein-like n=1 Tax=Styela clava TaxID=7725 RepID=UPI00193A36EE|nr:alpha-tocopherol transfer protein-like [Styela clava]